MSDVMIEAHGLTKHYGPVTALKNATFEVNRGEVVGFLGPNGAGKTTTMKILTCFIAPSDGTARIGGAGLKSGLPIDKVAKLGFIPGFKELATEEGHRGEEVDHPIAPMACDHRHRHAAGAKRHHRTAGRRVE